MSNQQKRIMYPYSKMYHNKAYAATRKNVQQNSVKAVAAQSKIKSKNVVKANKRNKPWKIKVHARTPFGHTEPYNYSDTVPLKQFPIATSTIAPTSSVIASVDLISALTAGTSDNTRLGDTVIVDYVDFHAIALNLTNTTISANTPLSDVSFRMLIVGSKSNVRVDPLTSIDGFGTINNSVVTTDAMIFYDSGIHNLTPTRGNTGTSYLASTGVTALYHNSFRLSKRVSFHNRKAAGMFVQFNGATLVAGSLFAIFYTSNAAGALNVTSVSTSFSVGFRDYDPDITAGISDRVSVLERQVDNTNLIARINELEEKLQQSYLVKKDAISSF